MTKVVVLFVLVAGCDLPKVRCEYTAPPSSVPPVPKERQDKLDELADLQLDIDLAIARHDKREIDFDEEMRKSAWDASNKAGREHAKNAGELTRFSLQATEEQNKDLERIARHRCAR